VETSETTSEDTFLIGDGSARLMRDYTDDKSQASQLMADDASPKLVVRDDLEDYVDPALEVRVDTRAEIDYAFYSYKREAYDIYRYTELKSSWMRGQPIKIEDLVVDDADKYLIDYLVSSVTDLYTWKQLAKLQAFANMGVSYARFVTDCECPVCKAADGKIMATENLLRVLCQGGSVTHRLCVCDLQPVVYRERHEGPLVGRLDEPLVTWGLHDALHVPRELLTDCELPTLVADMPHSEVDFVCMPAWAAENGVEDAQGLVAYLEDETLYVHNSYVGESTPVDYLRGFLQMDTVREELDGDTLRAAPSCWLDGQHVVKYQGHYYTADKGKRIK